MSAELPDENGYFGEFGGRYAPEIFMQAVLDLDQAWSRYRKDKDFQQEFQDLLGAHGGRPTPLYYAKEFTRHAGGAGIYLKREDLTSTGSHHVNAALGQALLAKKRGASLLLAETCNGMHGIAVATAARVFNMDCQIYIGSADARRQLTRVSEIESLGAELFIIGPDDATLLEANEAANRAMLGAMQNGYYVAMSAVGPHPVPAMVREFHSVIGRETRQQLMTASGALPDHLVACAAGGGHALGLFYPFLDTATALSGVESSGSDGKQATRFQEHRTGVYQGTKTLMRRDQHGQVMAGCSLAPGLRMSLMGPEYAYLLQTGRIRCDAVSDSEALETCALAREREHITLSLESAHALARGLQLASGLGQDKSIVISLSGRGVNDAVPLAGAGPTCRQQ